LLIHARGWWVDELGYVRAVSVLAVEIEARRRRGVGEGSQWKFIGWV
jgi:hypothetical protein